MKVGTFNNLLLCALEQHIVYDIKPNQRGKQTYIGQCKPITAEIPRSAQMIIYQIQSVKQLIYCFIISFLALCKPTPKTYISQH